MRDEDGMDGACSRDATLMHHLPPTKEGKMGLAQWERERIARPCLVGMPEFILMLYYAEGRIDLNYN